LVIFTNSCPTVIFPTAGGPNIITSFIILLLYLKDNKKQFA
jgi:hypothetical protein